MRQQLSSIDVSLDAVGVRTATREYFAESLAMRGVERRLRLDKMVNRAEFIAKSLPPRSVADGYFRWVAYLLWLRGVLDVAGAAGLKSELLAAEVEGLRVLADERDRFTREHPGCGKCGARNERFAIACEECGTKFTD